MKKKYIITLLTAIVMILLMQIGYDALMGDDSRDKIKVGFLYVGDSCNMYTQNFIHAQEQMELAMGDRVETIAKYNVAEGMEKQYIQELVDEDCDLIMGTSYGYQDQMKTFAQRYPQIQFCMATGDNADEAPVLSNYHTVMGAVYQGRYIAGVVAGMKMQGKSVTEAENMAAMSLKGKVQVQATLTAIKEMAGWTFYGCLVCAGMVLAVPWTKRKLKVVGGG